MKRTLRVLLTMAVAAALVGWAPAIKHGVTALPVVHAHSGCSNATLAGNYGFTLNGFSRVNDKSPISLPFDAVGVGTFDGVENFVVPAFTISNNGAVSVNNSYTATYTVNSDCSGLMIATPGTGGDNLTFAVVNGGAEVFFIDITAGGTWTGDMKKQ
jgi:hypothetical protein